MNRKSTSLRLQALRVALPLVSTLISGMAIAPPRGSDPGPQHRAALRAGGRVSANRRSAG